MTAIAVATRLWPLMALVALAHLCHKPAHVEGSSSPGAEREPATLRTVVGTGSAGYSGDGGPALQAQLNQPFHVSFGPQGEMYIADSANHAIRRVDRKTGRITTVAGCGRKGYSGDGGLATSATMNEPYGVVVDRAGNLYIVDRLNACIRYVDAKTGIISTLAGTGTPGYSGDGGLAGFAQLREPNGLALDGKGALYIADVADNRIRKVNLKDRVITTVCGTGRRAFAGDGGPARAASIDGARAVDVDRQGNLYLCERAGNRIRKIDARTGIIRTIAGTGAEGYSGDNGPAPAATFRGPKWISLDADGALYVVDTENHCVRRIDPKTGTITTVAGNGTQGGAGDGGPPAQAQLDRPHGCVVRNGLLYIADTNNHRIRVCPAK
jgi:sugar lactone lactonase YvrE